MDIETDYTLEREPELEDGSYDYICTELRVEGCYSPGERATWGYYGGSPGCPEEVELCQVFEVLVAEGPLRSYQKGPLTVQIPWEGEFTKDEEESVLDALMEAAKADLESAAEAAAEARYEARMDFERDSYRY
jgi:hypothetical protein